MALRRGFFGTEAATEERLDDYCFSLPKCGQCGLSRQCNSPRMIPTGKGNRSILFVGEAPGEEEDKQGKQFVGPVGRFLRTTVNGFGDDIDEGWVTNCVVCRPPKNRIQDKYIDACRPVLFRTIRDLRPKVIVALGLSAIKSLISPEWKGDIGGVTRWIGWSIPSRFYGAWICPVYHPSYILREGKDPVLMKEWRRHLQNAFKLERTKERPVTGKLKGLKQRIELVSNPRSARQRIRDLATKEGILAFDYETTGLKPDDPGHCIVTCSFCLNGEESFACAIDSSCYRSLSRVLRNRALRKVASNLKFEERWTRAKLGHGVARWYWDTMLAAHLLDNRPGITSLKFQAYVRLGVAGYEASVAPYLKAATANGFNRIRELSLSELLLYNGLDSLLEYQVMEHQRKEAGWLG